MNFFKELETHQLMVAVRTENPEDAYRAAMACLDGGVKFVEITFTVPDADQVVRELAKDPRASIGAGTILSPVDARKALLAGATYIVSPNFDVDVVHFTKNEGAISIPGACTPTEIYAAHKAGADIIKLFPFVEMGGLDFLKAMRGPFPDLRYMLCGGVTLENITRYLGAHAAGILVGTGILRRDLVETHDWTSIANLSREFVAKATALDGKNAK